MIGSMNWYPSHSAAVRLLTRLWPEIKRRIPNARVQIVGWQARSALKEFLEMPDVTIEENVPDIRAYFERTGVMLYAPARGSGMKVKILESFGFGVPVVTTSEGVEGLPAVDGVHAGVCEDDAGLIDRAVELFATQPSRTASGRPAGYCWSPTAGRSRLWTRSRRCTLGYSPGKGGRECFGESLTGSA